MKPLRSEAFSRSVGRSPSNLDASLGSKSSLNKPSGSLDFQHIEASKSLFNKPLGSLDFQYIENVGWCMMKSESEFCMLFNDGDRLILDSKSQSLHFYRKNEKEE